MKSERKPKPNKAIAIYEDAFSAFNLEKFEIQKDINEPKLNANEAVLQLVKNSRELRELKKQGLAKE